MVGPAVILADTMLEDVYSSEFLGIRLDQGLVWDDLINSIFSKLISGICVLRILSKYLPTHIRTMAYYDLIYPHLSTLTEVSLWGACSKSKFARMSSLKKSLFEFLRSCNFI